ncbi:ATP-grasp domain-containing protein, partial [Micromonospora musae]|uniref:ATP-grasp domain-containing protein n=1 Tax=Micromonospora musae TaxID=1894970 RepID=UPI0033C59FA0
STAFETAAGATWFGYERMSGILVEELLVGPEISVETATAGGATKILAVTRKQTGFAPLFMETGHTVNAGDPLADEEGEVARVTRAAIAALDVTEGVCHVELILTSSGPAVVEVNGRLAGDLIPYLVDLARGCDPCLVAAQVAVGDEPDGPRRQDGAAAIAFIHPPVTGKLDEFRFTPPADSETWLRRVDQLTSPGSEVTLPPDGYPSRIGFAVVTGADQAQCAQRLDACLAAAVVTVSPSEV